MSRPIDLNADVGEGFDDAGLYEIVSSVSIACGGHAGDEASMRAAIRLAKAAEARIGAHPSYPDREGWGRRAIEITLPDLRLTILEQIDALLRVADGMRASVTHCKPHGALYNDAARDHVLAGLFAETIAERHPEMRVVALAGSALVAACRDADVEVVEEGFADRAYAPDGSLLPRTEPGAVFDDPRMAGEQAVRLLEDARIGTICLHGDSPNALASARAVRRALEAAGATISPGV